MLLFLLLQTAAAQTLVTEPVPQDSTVEAEAAATRPETTTQNVGDVKVICRRRPVTGSLVRTTKECHTKSEWSRLDEDVRKQAGEYVDHGRGGSNGQ